MALVTTMAMRAFIWMVMGMSIIILVMTMAMVAGDIGTEMASAFTLTMQFWS